MQETINIEHLWEDIHGRLTGFVSKSINNKDDVSDIVQDTFIKVQTNINSLKNPAKVEGWIFQIARNIINDHYRKLKKSHENDNIPQDVTIDPTAFAEEDISIKIQTQDFSEYAGTVISELPEKYRIAVQLSDIEGLSMKEVAEELNISISAAKSRVQRGRKMIKEIILKCCAVNADKYGNIVDFEPHGCNTNDSC
jgi:RNA polymerase sigma-70 factor, ECF subfamily